MTELTITITVETEDGEIFRAETATVERAVDELYRFERHILKKLDDAKLSDAEKYEAREIERQREEGAEEGPLP